MKQIPEDFIVKEIVSKKPIGEGEYTWFTLKKKNWELAKVLDLIAKKCQVSRNRFQYAGLKDKNAVTYQTVSAWKVPEKLLKSLEIKDIELSDIDKNNRRIKTDDIKANFFQITVRDLSQKDLKDIGKKISKLKGGVLNLFDDQRFGNRKTNHIIGKFLVKKDFPRAVKALTANPGNWESIVLKYISKNPRDFKGSINCLPKNLKMFLVNSYQSYLWNSFATNYFIGSKSRKNIKIPIIGYRTKLENYPKVKKYIEKMLKKEALCTEDFKNIFEDITFAGDERDLFVYPKRVKWKLERDELNKNKSKLIISFELQKGSYGTYIIKSLLSI